MESPHEAFEADRVRILVLGAPDVGKTVLCRSLEERALCAEYSPTMQSEGYRSSIQSIDGSENIPVLLIDSIGWGGDFEMFDADSRRQRISDAQGYIIMYSTTSMESFELIHEIHEELLDVNKNTPEKRIAFVLVGTKNDVVERVVLQRHGTNLANQFDCPFFELSLLHKGESGQSGMDGVALRKRIVDSISKALLQDIYILNTIHPSEEAVAHDSAKKSKRKTSSRREKRRASKKSTLRVSKADVYLGMAIEESSKRSSATPHSSPVLPSASDDAQAALFPPTPAQLAKSEQKSRKKVKKKASRRQRQQVVSQLFGASDARKSSWQGTVGRAQRDPRSPNHGKSKQKWGTYSMRRVPSSDGTDQVDDVHFHITQKAKDVKKKKRRTPRRTSRKLRHTTLKKASLTRSHQPRAPQARSVSTINMHNIIREASSDYEAKQRRRSSLEMPPDVAVLPEDSPKTIPIKNEDGGGGEEDGGEEQITHTQAVRTNDDQGMAKTLAALGKWKLELGVEEKGQSSQSTSAGDEVSHDGVVEDVDGVVEDVDGVVEDVDGVVEDVDDVVEDVDGLEEEHVDGVVEDVDGVVEDVDDVVEDVDDVVEDVDGLEEEHVDAMKDRVYPDVVDPPLHVDERKPSMEAADVLSPLSLERWDRQRKVDELLRRVEQSKQRRIERSLKRPPPRTRFASGAHGSLGSLFDRMERMASLYDEDAADPNYEQEYTQAHTNMFIFKPRRASTMVPPQDSTTSESSVSEDDFDDDEPFSRSASSEENVVGPSCTTGRIHSSTLPSRLDHSWRVGIASNPRRSGSFDQYRVVLGIFRL